ncbi:MAG: hypothetical protein KKE51_02845 [Gammaproteobacteria bacterium]|nr:hypothetical protein [Gammaproteobacteria bacterium]MBU1603054.1 hypothetical protein [Gammaproteobacteria bacterium]MBU2433759.1 hypothetical protein [Gammaproteobacteria bacterium]MBU2449929.1 hypothetical protein [Gammaproteobacteria bacterium]
MDLLDFSDCKLYFEDELPAEAERLIAQAADDYGDPSAELALLRAHLLAPEHLTVLVSLYRYYFYQHRLDEVLIVAEHAMRVSARHLGIPADWRQIDEAQLGSAAATSFGLLRFYLLALKAESVVLLRLGRIAESRDRLTKLATLDSRDHLGAAKLLEVIDEFQSSSEDSDSTPELQLVAA